MYTLIEMNNIIDLFTIYKYNLLNAAKQEKEKRWQKCRRLTNILLDRYSLDISMHK